MTVLLGYRSTLVSLPSNGSASSVALRVKNKPANAIAAIAAVYDFNYALRVVLSRSSPPFPAGRLLTVDFDGCQSAAAPTAINSGCTVEGCSNVFGPLDGGTCTVTP